MKTIAITISTEEQDFTLRRRYTDLILAAAEACGIPVLPVLLPNLPDPALAREYARMFDRITDNSKVLRVTGMKQEELMPFYEGMKMELAKLNLDNIRIDQYRAAINERMEAYYANKQ